jgi:hypothetical protein
MVKASGGGDYAGGSLASAIDLSSCRAVTYRDRVRRCDWREYVLCSVAFS